MEVTKWEAIKKRIAKLFLKEPRPFTTKRELNWTALKKSGAIGIGVAVLILLILPAPKQEKTAFHEQGEAGSAQSRFPESDPSRDALSQISQAQAAVRPVPVSLDYLYQNSSGGGGSPRGGSTRNSPMVLAREGADSRTQLPAGSRIVVCLTEKVIVGGQPMPVIGKVSRDLIYEDSVAIPEGAKMFGDVSFDAASERASISWRAVELPDGRRRALSAVGVGIDGQGGVEGRIHSEALKNTIGETVTRFIGAYAQGAMQQGVMGAQPGGAENGLKNAVAETAKLRADSWAEGMKKERSWIELDAGAESLAVLNQSFSFRDPGSTYGK